MNALNPIYFTFKALNHVISSIAESQQRAKSKQLNQIFQHSAKETHLKTPAGTRPCQQICSKQDFTRGKLFLWDQEHVGTWRAALISKHLLTLYSDHSIRPVESFSYPPTNNPGLPFHQEWHHSQPVSPECACLRVCPCVFFGKTHLLCLRPCSVSEKQRHNTEVGGGGIDLLA